MRHRTRENIVLQSQRQREMDSAEDFVNVLKAGYANIQVNHQRRLQYSLALGECLLYAYGNFTRYIITKEIKSTWSKWLEEVVGIHKSCGKRLRFMASVLQKYAKFKLLAISFNKLYLYRKLICELLSSNLKCDWM